MIFEHPCSCHCAQDCVDNRPVSVVDFAIQRTFVLMCTRSNWEGRKLETPFTHCTLARLAGCAVNFIDTQYNYIRDRIPPQQTIVISSRLSVIDW